MYGIQARNVHQVLPCAMNQLQQHGVKRESRNGPVLVFPAPVIVQYERPWERVMFWPERDCNPFFHLVESLWMLAGRNDVAFVAAYVKRMADFSDDGQTFNAAYGFRWRKHFGKDQLYPIALALKNNPDCRRQVLAMWDGFHDLGLQSKDLPCNTHAYFLRDTAGRLTMTVCNRSNDLVWGALGANAVHFSVLQEYLAMLIGCEMGPYYQFSNNMHGYLATAEPLFSLGNMPYQKVANNDPYQQGTTNYQPLLSPGELIEHWEADLQAFMELGTPPGLKTKFFRKVVAPMCNAYRRFKETEGGERYGAALEALTACEAPDWQRAGNEWLLRRKAKFEKVMDDGVQHG